MADPAPASLTIHELRDRLRSGLTPEAVIDSLCDRIERLNPSLRAYLEIPDRGRLREEARRQWDAAPQGRLRGIPITVKDNICIRGQQTGCGSRILEGFRSPYDATVITRLRREGAVLIPRANMDEFAFGSSTENSAYGPTRNPRASDDRVPGGSSGGSAAAVAADLAIAALGSDTGGSIRQPAAFCGIVGLKPTYGRVSRYGLVAFASSLDQIGPLTKDARDAAILLSAVAGVDSQDSTSAPNPSPAYDAGLEEPIRGLRIGLPREAMQADGIASPVRVAVDQALKVFGELGAVAADITLPHLDQAVEVYYIIATAEASSNLARFDGVRYGRRAAGGGSLLDMYLDTRSQGFGAEAKRRILLGTYVLSHGYYDAYYLKGMKVRTLIKRAFDEAFKRVDVIAMPTAPTTAFRLGEKVDDPLQMYLSDIFTISANLAGVPAISIPCGVEPGTGLPVGLQLFAPPFGEDLLLRAAHAYERRTGWRAKLKVPA